MKTVAVISQKGGAGKTTMSVHVAVAAVQAGENVVIIDLDPQTNAASWGDLREAEDVLQGNPLGGRKNEAKTLRNPYTATPIAQLSLRRASSRVFRGLKRPGRRPFLLRKSLDLGFQSENRT